MSKRKDTWNEWKDIAEEHGVGYKNFWERVNRYDWTPERAATTEVRKPVNRKWLKIANQNGVSYSTYIDRVKRGWTEEKAALTPINRRSDKKWQILAEKNGIAYDTYLRRVHDYFWTPEDAATTPAMTHAEVVEKSQKARAELTEVRHELINDDPNNLFKITKQHLEIAEKNGIVKNTVHARIYNLGWTVQDAIHTPVQRGFEKPKNYEKFLKIALENGISQSTYRDRVKRGWDLEKASTHKLIKPTDRYRDDAEWIEKAVKNGIKDKLYIQRVRNGWSPEEAATTPVLTLKKGRKFLNKERAENSKNAFRNFRKVTRKQWD